MFCVLRAARKFDSVCQRVQAVSEHLPGRARFSRLESRCCAEIVRHCHLREIRACRRYHIFCSRSQARSSCHQKLFDNKPDDQSLFLRSGMEVPRPSVRSRVEDVGLSFQTVAGGQRTSLDRRIAVTAAMPFLKPGVQRCGFARLSGMQYLSTSNVVLGLARRAVTTTREEKSVLNLGDPTRQPPACRCGSAPWASPSASSSACGARWQTLLAVASRLQGCAFVKCCRTLLSSDEMNIFVRSCFLLFFAGYACGDRNSFGALCGIAQFGLFVAWF